jgi:carbamoyl-phosphate synthase large subunit
MKFNVQLIGADLEAINKAEDRALFREAMDKSASKAPARGIANTLEEALEGLDFVGLPTIIRPSFTLGGTGGGIAYNKEEFIEIVATRPRRLARHRSPD